MGILSTIEKRAASAFTHPELARKIGLLDDPAPSGVTVTQKKAFGLTAFWNGVMLISSTIASLPLQVFERMEPQGRRMVPNHRVYRLLHIRPNPFMTPFTFKEIRTAHLLTWGNSYAEIEYDQANRPIALWPLLPDRTDVEIRNGEKFYWTIVNGTKVWLSADRVLHVPGLGFDGLKGYNVVKMHRDSLGLSIAANEYGARFFGNSGRPSGFLSHPGKPGKEDRERIREEWNQLHSGLTRAQRTAVLYGGMKWERVSVPPEEAQFLSTRVTQIDEVARILNINPILLQQTQGATTWGTAIGQFLTAYAKFTIQHWLERDEDAMNWSLFSPEQRGRLYVKYNMNGLQRGDPKTQAEINEIKRRNAVINADEWREQDEQNPLPDGQGKIYTIPANMFSLKSLADEQKTPLPNNEVSRSRSHRHTRARVVRQRLRRAHLAAFRDGAGRFTRREVQALEAALRRAADDEDPVASINRWIEEFYPGQQEAIQRIMLPIISAYVAAVAVEAAEEVGADPPEMDVFAREYTSNLARREIGSSIGQLRTMMDAAVVTELVDALRTRAEDWREKRPDKIASNEVVRAGAGATRHVWQESGISSLVWRADLDPCPLCAEMDGRAASVQGFFLGQGDTVNPGGDTAPLTVDEPIGGPPLHAGCECDIEPA